MDILTLIQTDHEEACRALDELMRLVELAPPADDLPDRTVAVADLLRVHMAAEERVLYQTALSLDGPLHEAAVAGTIEHDLIGRLLDRIEETAPGGELRAVLRVLIDLVHLHVRRREEGTMFPRFREDLTDEERAALGFAHLAEKERLRRIDGHGLRRQ